MKKLKIFFIIILLLSFFSLALPTLSYAEDLDPNTYSPSDNNIDPIVAERVSPIYSILYVIAIVVSIITLAIIGLKFIVGSAQEKAEYKKHLIPVAIGICIIVWLFTIIGMLSSISDSIYTKQQFVGPRKTDNSNFIGPQYP